jgi:hypothetical protein
MMMIHGDHGDHDATTAAQYAGSFFSISCQDEANRPPGTACAALARAS